jgi:hypothetical protein
LAYLHLPFLSQCERGLRLFSGSSEKTRHLQQIFGPHGVTRHGADGSTSRQCCKRVRVILFARAIQGWLGHRSITSTAVYTALAPNRFKDFWR